MHINININSLPREIVFCRHAESVGNAKGKDDNSDENLANHRFPLTVKGQSQASEVRDFLEKEYTTKFSAYFVSTFLRTHSTFQSIFGEDTVPYEDPRLDEWWKGIFHSLSKSELKENHSLELKTAEKEGWYHYRPPQGEAGKDVEVRILSFLNSLTPVPSIFVCGHGRWFKFFERILLCLPRQATEAQVPQNCSLIRFRKNSTRYENEVLFTPS